MFRSITRLTDAASTRPENDQSRPHLAQRLVLPVMAAAFLFTLTAPAAHADFTNWRNALDQLGSQTRNDPQGFLDGFSPIHTQWHQTRNQDQQQYGFLLFHHRVCLWFNANVNARQQTPITPFTAQ